MIGILTEKPSASRNFAKALGSIKGVFNNEAYEITNAIGHLLEFDEPHKMVSSNKADRYKSWDISLLPWNEKDINFKRTPKKGMTGQLQVIKRVLSNVDEICIATDDDPSGEGSLLAWEIIDYLNLHNKKITRMFFIDESEKEIKKAFINRVTLKSMLDDPDYLKADYRSRWDLMSMQFTRIATVSSNLNLVIRQGRLKSVMVKLVGDGLKAYNDYKKVIKYTNKFKDDKGVVYSSIDEPIVDNKDAIITDYEDSNVIKKDSVLKRQAPPKLIDLSTLSSMLAPKGYNSKLILDTYQKMYQDGIVSYPRTEDKFISNEQFNEFLSVSNNIADVIGIDSSLLIHKKPRITHVKDGGSHGANRPGTKVPKSLDYLKDKYGEVGAIIYETLARNSLSMLCEDYEYYVDSAYLEKYPKYTGSTNIPKSLGWKKIYNNNNDDDDGLDTGIGLGSIAKPFIAEVINKRPPKPTMKWLMKALEKYEVGTGATRTSTYAEITNSKSKTSLMKDVKGSITLTDCGNISYVIGEGTKISDVLVTEELFKEMDYIAKGKANADLLLNKLQDMVIYDRSVMVMNKDKLEERLGKDMLDKYNNNFEEKEKYRGYFVSLDKDVSFNREWGSHRFTDDECDKLLNGEEIVLTLKSKKTNKPYKIHGKLAEQTFNGHKFIGFLNLGFVEDENPFTRAKTFFENNFKYKFSEDELLMLEDGNEIFVEGLISKKNTPFSAYVSYGKNEKGYMGMNLRFER